MKKGPQPKDQKKEKPKEPKSKTIGVGDEQYADWTRFDINVSLRNLRSDDPRVVRNELRKLHLRWWHASEPKMHKILRGAGIEPKRLGMIKGIVHTCRECRAWARPDNTVLPSVKLPTKFNENVQADLFFYRGTKYKAFHVIEECLRYSNAEAIDHKQTDYLVEAYMNTWHKLFGPAQTLYCDGEGGLANETAKQALANVGTKIFPKASGQHAHIIEARNGLLRSVMHKIEMSCNRLSIEISFSRLVAEGVFVCNAFSFYN